LTNNSTFEDTFRRFKYIFINYKLFFINYKLFYRLFLFIIYIQNCFL